MLQSELIYYAEVLPPVVKNSLILYCGIISSLHETREFGRRTIDTYF